MNRDTGVKLVGVARPCEAQMLLHFVVISFFDRNTGGAKLGPKDPDLALQEINESHRRLGLKPIKPQDPMWYLMSHGKFVGYVKVFRNERYARNWLWALSEKDASSINRTPWA
jgi:hypothetical protein